MTKKTDETLTATWESDVYENDYNKWLNGNDTICAAKLYVSLETSIPYSVLSLKVFFPV